MNYDNLTTRVIAIANQHKGIYISQAANENSKEKHLKALTSSCRVAIGLISRLIDWEREWGEFSRSVIPLVYYMAR